MTVLERERPAAAVEAAPAPRRLSARPLLTVAEALIVPVVVVLLWQFAYGWFGWSESLIPKPTTVIDVLVDWVGGGAHGAAGNYSGTWFDHVLASAERVLAGFALGTVLGVVIGAAIGYWRHVGRLFEPTLHLLRPIPITSWIPLAIVWFGVNYKVAIFLIFLGAFYPILVNTIHGVRNIDTSVIRAASMLGASRAQMVRQVVMPAALPSILAGLRIGLGISWMAVIVAEMLAAKSGVGYVLWDSYYYLKTPLVIAAMVTVGVMGFLSDRILLAVTQRALRWQSYTSHEGA